MTQKENIMAAETMESQVVNDAADGGYRRSPVLYQAGRIDHALG